MNRKMIFVGALLLVQCLAVGFLIYRYERVVTRGTEVRFRCQAYDPKDVFRGRYLRVTVRERAEKIPNTVTEDRYSERNKFYVRIEPSTNGLWRVAEAAYEPSAEGVWVKPKSTHVGHTVDWNDKRKDESYDDFCKRRDNSPYALQVDFPDQLFVNEKLAPKAEARLRTQGLAPIAVYRVLDGEIVITDIEVDGQSVTKHAK